MQKNTQAQLCWSNKQHTPIFPLLVGAMGGMGEGSTTMIKFTKKALFLDLEMLGEGGGEWGIMVGGAGVGGNEKEDVKSS